MANNFLALVEEKRPDMSPIPDAPGYFITTGGRVFSQRQTNTGRSDGRLHELKQSLDRAGYLRVALCFANKARSVSVHRLVLWTFRGPAPSPHHQARHLNGQRSANHLDNLAWGTAVENMEDRRRHRTLIQGEKVFGAKLTANAVREIRWLYSQGRSRSYLAEIFRVELPTVCKIVDGRSWKHLLNAEGAR